jgi:hypothetical protein
VKLCLQKNVLCPTRKQTCNNISNYVFNGREGKQRSLYSCELIILPFFPNYTKKELLSYLSILVFEEEIG